MYVSDADGQFVCTGRNKEQRRFTLYSYILASSSSETRGEVKGRQIKKELNLNEIFYHATAISRDVLLIRVTRRDTKTVLPLTLLSLSQLRRRYLELGV